jgi:hypothetical protein
MLRPAARITADVGMIGALAMRDHTPLVPLVVGTVLFLITILVLTAALSTMTTRRDAAYRVLCELLNRKRR